MKGLIDRGYTPVQAAALVGHILQESGGNPAEFNAKEDAHGLLQWRLDRWQALQNFARERGVPVSDPNLQLDFIGREMHGNEARNAAGFLNAGDVAGASAALQPYIRFGDNSAARRAALAQDVFSGGSGGGVRVPVGPPGGRAAGSGGGGVGGSAAGLSIAGLRSAGGMGGDSTEQGEDATAKTTDLAAGIGSLRDQFAKQDAESMPQLTPMAPMQPAMTPAMMRARQMAQAMLAKQMGINTDETNT